MDNFGELTSETVSMSTQLLTEVYLALRKKTDSLFFGNLNLTISQSFSIFLTMNRNSFAELPKEIREIYRCSSTAVPEVEIIVRQLLRICGFSKDGELVQLIIKFGEFCKTQIPSRRFGLPLYELKELVKEAGDNLPNTTNEREAFLVALHNFVTHQLPESEKQLCQSLIVNIFGPSVQPQDSEEMHRLILDYFKFRDLELSPALERNIVDCFEVAGRWSSLHFVESDIAGCDIVVECVKFLLAKVSQKHVIARTIFPKVYTIGQLYGEFVPKTTGEGSEFRPGVIQSVMRELIAQFPSAMDDDLGRMHTIHNEKNIERWIVFDATASTDWVEGLTTGIDLSTRFIVLPNFEKLKIPPNLKLFFRSESVSHLSPSVVVRLGRIRPGGDYSWQKHLQVHLEKLEIEYPVLTERQLPHRVNGWMTKFFESLFEGKGMASLDWIMRPTNLELINNFLTIFKSMLTEFMTSSFDRDEHQAKLDAIISSMMFVSVSISIGSLVATVHSERFEHLVEDKLSHAMSDDNKGILSKCLSPITFLAEEFGKVFEPLVIDLNSQDELKLTPKLRFVSPQQVWYSKFLGKLTASKRNLLLLGDGRASLGHLLTQITASASESNSNLQTVRTKWTSDFRGSDLLSQIKKSLAPRNKLLYVPKTAGGVALVADDVNMPPRDIHGDIGPLELMRCLLREGQIFDTALADPVKFEGIHALLCADLSISQADCFTRRYRRKTTLVGLQGNKEAEFKTSIFQVSQHLNRFMLPDYFDKDMVTAACHKVSEVLYAVIGEICRLHPTLVTSDMMHLDKISDLVSMACSVRVPFDREDQLISHLLGELMLYIKLGYRSISENQMRGGILTATSKVYRSFDPAAVELDRYHLSVSNQIPGVFRLSFEDGGADNFKKKVSDIVSSTKEFRDFPLLEEPLEALHGCQRLLSMSGSRLILQTSNDPRQLVSLAARLMKFELVEIDLSSTDQIGTVARQLGKILEDALAKKSWKIVLMRLGSIRDPGVMRLVQDALVLGDVSQLTMDKSAVRDAIFSDDLESVDEGQFVQSVWNHRCRFVFVRDSFSNSIQKQLNSYVVIKSSLGPLTIAEWQATSLISVALAIMDKFEELDMTTDEKHLTAKCLAEIYLFSKPELAKNNIEIRQNSFNNSCQYACEIRSRAKSEIKDQLGNLQTAISRFKALNRVREELVSIEVQARLKLKESEKILQEIVQILSGQQQEVLKKKE
jgi:hypothetical protein